ADGPALPGSPRGPAGQRVSSYDRPGLVGCDDRRTALRPGPRRARVPPAVVVNAGPALPTTQVSSRATRPDSRHTRGEAASGKTAPGPSPSPPRLTARSTRGGPEDLGSGATRGMAGRATAVAGRGGAGAGSRTGHRSASGSRATRKPNFQAVM